MNFYAISGLLNGITSTLVGMYIFTRDIDDRRYQTYGLFCLSLSVWSYGYFFWHISDTATEALVWVRVVMAGAIFIPVTNFHHIAELLEKPPWEKRWIWVGYLICIAFLFLDLFSSFFVRGVSPKLTFPFWPDPGPAFAIYLLFFFYFVVRFTYLLIAESHETSGIRQNQLRYLVLALTLGYVGGATNFLLWYDIPVPPVGNPLVSLYVVLFIYAVIKFRLMDINVVIRKSLTYALLLSLLLIPCYLLVVWGQQLVFGNINLFFSIFTLGLFLIVGFLFPRLRFQTEEALERVLFKKRYDYRETLSRSSKDMVSMVDLDALSNNLVHTIGRALGVEKASLFLVDDVKGFFELKATIGLDLDEFKELVLSRDDFLVQRLTRNPEPIVREEMEMTRNGSESGAIVERMRQLVAAISLPIVSKDRLIGILNLGHKDGREMYSAEDLELLSTLANQAAIAIDNARLYENLKQSQNIIRRADRLSSLGQLTAGLAHEIRNPLVAIRTFTQLLPERYQDVDFRNSFQSLALKEVDRICGLVNDLLSFARPSAPNVAAENVNEIVDSIVRILETEAKEKGVQIYRRLATNLPKVLIDKEQIKQVSMNIILNALQSIQGKGVVEVSTRIFSKDGASEFVQVSVHDSGVGIPEKDLENIFNPFFTTKKEGVGLGLSITHQIVQEHGGYIVVESQVGRGTTFFINLPVKRSNLQETRTHPQINEENPGR
jgi:two-component system NtrC family sensor kinase